MTIRHRRNPTKDKLVSSDERVERKRQHTKPCGDCPWARAALPGWLGDKSSQWLIQLAHSETVIDCHTIIDKQCAGTAIYRANVAKRCRDASILVLPKDEALVFASPMEFTAHHESIKLKRKS